MNGSDPLLHHQLAEYEDSLATANDADSDTLLTHSTSSGSAGGNLTEDADQKISANRFRDNDELRYSLRSLEKYAPWIRKIFIVTNGQVPRWLNLEHPRVEVISHAMLFKNKSHLPTFSSPAIESHLHEIPGLSERFLYFNDDVFFANNVWPDDFETRSGGQKIFLSWSVPACNKGCPGTWIGDGYCDMACNTSLCGWDGGDCLNVSGSSNSRYSSWSSGSGYYSNWYQNQKSKYCASSCPSSWIADRYCDKGCNVRECGYDGGDCGTDEMVKHLHHIDISEDVKSVVIPESVDVFYLNLTVFQHGRVTEAYHDDNSELVRTATISQKSKVMAFTLYPEKPSASLEINLAGYLSANESVLYEQTLNLSIVRAYAPKKTESSNSSLDISMQGGSSSHQSSPLNSNSTTSSDSTTLLSGRVLHSAGLSTTFFPVKIQEFDHDDMFPSLARWKRVTVDDVAEAVSDSVMIKSDVFLHKWISNTKEKQLNPDFDPGDSVPNIDLDPMLNVPFADAPEIKWQGSPPVVEDVAQQHTARQMMDAFGDSLIHVNNLMNHAFGGAARKVPAHMPHFMKVSVLKELHAKWPEEYEKTSAAHVRSGQDMQFAFAYFYWVMHAYKLMELVERFESYDSDKSGYLSLNELRSAAVDLYKHVKAKDWESLLDEVAEAAIDVTGIEVPMVDGTPVCPPGRILMPDSFKCERVDVPISFTIFNATRSIREKLSGKKEMKYKWELAANGGGVSFIMVENNSTEMLKAFDNVRRNRPKYVCLNDNMNSSLPMSETIKHIHDLYESFFPKPSQFELPPDRENQLLYLDQILRSRSSGSALQFNANVLIAIIIMVMGAFTASVIVRKACLSPTKSHPKRSAFLRNM